MVLRELTDEEQQILKLAIMQLYQREFINDIAAEWLIQALGLSES